MRFCKSCDDWGFPASFGSHCRGAESAEMGRKAKHLTESAKKKAKREKRTVGLQKSIYLGKLFSAWTDAKRTTEASSDRSVIRPSR